MFRFVVLSALVSLCVANSYAGIQYTTGSPVSASTTSTVNNPWTIGGTTVGFVQSDSVNQEIIIAAATTGSNLAIFVTSVDKDIVELQNTQTVSSSLTGGVFNPTLDSYAVFGGSAVISGDTDGSGYFGFSFVESAVTRYGWAFFNVSGTSFSITEWAYEDTTSSIDVGDDGTGGGTTGGGVPEPTGFAIIGLVGLAVGLKRRNRR